VGLGGIDDKNNIYRNREQNRKTITLVDNCTYTHFDIIVIIYFHFILSHCKLVVSSRSIITTELYYKHNIKQ